MEYFLIAAGGTGAMCAQAFIHMAAAGCAKGDASYHLLLIDKDYGSDARTACVNLLDAYNGLRNQLGNMDNSLLRLPSIKLYGWNFSEEILDEYQRQTGNNPASLGAMTLHNLLNPRNELETDRLLRTFYSEDELNLDLDRGFYGHPNIGSAVFSYIEKRMTASVYQNKAGRQITNEFMQELRASLARGETHVYLFASLFGGTGATIIPNMVHLLRSLDGNDKLVLGCGVMMPYFRLPNPKADSIEELAHIRPADTHFEEQTREALRYYEESGLTNELMNLTLIGSSSLDVTSEIYASGGKQTQHYHMVLQIAATVANRFFDHTLGNMPNQLGQGNRRAGEVLFWKIAPNDMNRAGIYRTLTPSELGLSEEFEKMNRFLRFSVVVSNYLRAMFQCTNGEDDDVERHRSVEQLRHNRLVKITSKREWGGHGVITEEVINSRYQIPIAQASDYGRLFISYYYDIALSGYDWSQYRELVPDPSFSPVTVNGTTYYRYVAGGIRGDFFQYAQDRWTDVINIEKMKSLQEANKPIEAVNEITLNDLFSYMPIDAGRKPNDETRYPGNIANIYTDKVLPSYKSGFLNLNWEETSMSEVYDKIYKFCE